MTNGEFVSRFINGVNALNMDSHISRRYIMSIGRQKAESYTAQKWEDKTILKESNLFSYIDCIEMESMDKISCECLGLEWPRCSILMKSKKRIPGLITSKYGASILNVTNVGRDIRFKGSDVNSIIRNAKRSFSFVGQKMYYEQDGYIFITDYEIELVSATVLSVKKDEVVDVFGCNKKNECKSFWDYDFVCPQKLQEAVCQETLNELFQGPVRIPVDENPDQDSNIKSKKSN